MNVGEAENEHNRTFALIPFVYQPAICAVAFCTHTKKAPR